MKILRKIKQNAFKIIGVLLALVILAFSLLYLMGTSLFYFLIAICFIIGGLPFFVSIILESQKIMEKDEMFLEFSRNLVESVQAGTPISKSILNIQSKDYGKLNPYVQKLANQISLGIPIKAAFETFARDIGSITIKRAVTIISESEKAGGQIEDVLESVVKSVSQIEKLKKERRAAMYNLVVQGYIIFLIFIVIMLVMQYKVLPIASGLGQEVKGPEDDIIGDDFMNIFGSGEARATPEQLAAPFIWLLVVQGLFAGLVIGKLSEGNFKAGFKHSFILIIMAILASSGARLFFGPAGG